MRKTFLTIMMALVCAPVWALTVTSEAGKLSQAVSSASVTQLTVNGTIDARDFAFLTTLTKLTDLDLSAVTIASYVNTTTDPRGALSGQANTLPTTALLGLPLQRLVLPTSLRAIGAGALAGCTSLTSLTIPSQVDSIGDYALSGCTGLTSLTLPASVTYLGRGALAHCTSLVTLDAQGVRHLGEEALLDCRALTTVKLGNNLSYVGEKAFAATGLKSINLASMKQVKALGDYTFVLTDLNALTLPGKLQSVGEGSLLAQTLLTEIALPETVTYLNSYAMVGATGLKNLHSQAANVPALGEQVWYGVNQKNVKLLVPGTSVNAYRSADQWKEFAIATEYKTGDVNMDGIVDVADVSDIINKVLGHNPQPFDDFAADVNHDGIIDVADISGVINIVLYGDTTHVTGQQVSVNTLDEGATAVIIDQSGEARAVKLDLGETTVTLDSGIYQLLLHGAVYRIVIP